MDKVALWVVPSMVAEPTSAFPRVTATCSEVKAAGVCKSVRVRVNACALAGVKEYSAGGATLGRPMMLASSSSTAARAGEAPSKTSATRLSKRAAVLRMLGLRRPGSRSSGRGKFIERGFGFVHAGEVLPGLQRARQTQSSRLALACGHLRHP